MICRLVNNVPFLTKTALDIASSKWFMVFKDDVESVKSMFLMCLQGNSFPFEMIQKIELIDLFIWKEIGLDLLSCEDLNRCSSSPSCYLALHVFCQ